MSEFKKREKAEEAKFAQDQEMNFKIRVRRNKLLGQWAADLLGNANDESADYADRLVQFNLDKPGEDSLFEKIRADFDAANIVQSDHQIRRTMSDLLETAKQQLQSETAS